MPHTLALLLRAASSLRTSLAHYWKLEAASGSRLDSVGGVSLTDHATVAQVTGIVGNAAGFTGASSQYLSATDTAALRGGDRAYSFAGWIYLTSPTTVQEIFSKGTSPGAASTSDYRLFCSGSNTLGWRVSNGTTQTTIQKSGLTANTWYFVYVYHDPDTDTIGISINNSIPTTAAFVANAAHLPGGEFRIGAASDGTLYMTGRMDELGHWLRLLTPTERGMLYNAGVGATYPFTGRLSSPAQAVAGTFSYSSSIDAIANLYAEYSYPEGGLNLPILIVMHGYGGNTASIGPVTRLRLARRGLFVCVVSMRGRDSASGTPDSGRRELYDIYDVLAYLRTTFPTRVSATVAGVAGYSGGGGNVLGCAAKFPDAFTVYADHFGMSDYGHDPTTGWTGTSTAWMGGTTVAVPDNYYANYHLGAVPVNLTGGHLWIFQDMQDATVPVAQSQQMAAVMLAAGRTNYDTNYTTTGDVIRWTHNDPDLVPDLQYTEAYWASALTNGTYPAWTVPVSGTLAIAGYIVTKRFNLMLSTGLSEYGTVVYDMTARTFTITCATGAYTYTLTLHGQTPSASVSATINGVTSSQTADSNGNATWTG